MRHDQQGFSANGIYLEHEVGALTAILRRSLSYTDKDGVTYTAHAPLATDGGSIPKFFYRLIGPPYASPYLGAYIIHDSGCVRATSLAIAGQYWEAVVLRKEYDKLFKEMLLFLGCARLKASAMHKGVRLGAKSLNKYHPKKYQNKC